MGTPSSMIGKGSGKRVDKTERDSLPGIAKSSIRRLARRGGVRRMSGLIYEETNAIMEGFVGKVFEDSIIYCRHSKRKTIKSLDVVYALKRQGKSFYGFSTRS